MPRFITPFHVQNGNKVSIPWVFGTKVIIEIRFPSCFCGKGTYFDFAVGRSNLVATINRPVLVDVYPNLGDTYQTSTNTRLLGVNVINREPSRQTRPFALCLF